MIKVSVDGADLNVDLGGIKTMGELVELVKTQIDPDAVIGSLKIEGRDLLESDWRSPLSAQGNRQLEIVTVSKHQFVTERLHQASGYVSHIKNEFDRAKEAFQQGSESDGNTFFGNAVTDLQAFFEWYSVVLEAGFESRPEMRAEVLEQVNVLAGICEQLVQQQLYNSWWALGETIQNKLIPQLCQLEASCDNLSKQGLQ